MPFEICKWANDLVTLCTSFLFAEAHQQRSRSASVARSKGIGNVADAHQ
jgi:hypothetical protein